MDFDTDLETLKDEILLATLPNIVFDGWSPQSLRDGARAAGHGTLEVERAFPGGVPDLVEHFSIWADRRMVESLQSRDLSVLRVQERIALAVRLRLTLLEPYKEAVRRLVSYVALPQNTALGVRLLYRTVDEIWYAAGDTATDFNFYTKRALLGGVYSTTVLYWINDVSDESADTWGFLERRLHDVMRVGRTASRVGRLGGLIGRLPSPVRFARQFRRHALGI
jgi:ubiquinone biosynthesis protein COQ9